MTIIEIKREIRRWYGFRNGKIRVNLRDMTFTKILGDCISIDVDLPPHIKREIKLKEILKK